MDFAGLKVLVVLPMYGGSLPIGNYCVAALRELGLSVRVFDAPEIRPAFMGLEKLDLSESGLSAMRGHLMRLVGQAIWIMAQEQKPQLLLALAQAPLDRALLKRLSASGIRTVMWFVEDYKVFSYWESVAPLYDAFAIIQKQPFLEMLRAIGQEHAFYLPLAALPSFHKPMDLAPDEARRYGSGISVVGAGYPNRRKAFAPLSGRDFKIWGNDWDGEEILAANIQEEGRRISAEEAVKIFNASEINLNLHSSLAQDPVISGGDFVNPRTFELAACGAFQVVDKRSLLRELFDESELPCVETPEEFYMAIDHFAALPKERAEYAARARARVLAEHTYRQRMLTLLEYMRVNFGLEPPARETPPELPPHLKEAVHNLKKRLGLGEDAAFADVVAALRRETGELDETSVAILFLDEWQKQNGGSR